MSRYLQKYKGKYRVKAFYDLSTNDYPRLKDGNINPSFDDLYIPCQKNIYVMHYQRDVLMCICPTSKRGRNTLRKIYETYISKDVPDNFDLIMQKLTDEDIIINIEETDKEFIFYFKDANMDKVSKVIKPIANGADIPPFSPKNLPKTKYTIPTSDLAIYKDLTASYDNKLALGRMNQEFLQVQQSKLKKGDNTDYKANMKLVGISGKEYWHYVGMWDEYLEFIKMKVTN